MNHPRQNFEKKTEVSYFIYIRPAGFKLLYADRRREKQAGMTKLILAFRNFYKRTLESYNYAYHKCQIFRRTIRTLW